MPHHILSFFSFLETVQRIICKYLNAHYLQWVPINSFFYLLYIFNEMKWNIISKAEADLYATPGLSHLPPREALSYIGGYSLVHVLIRKRRGGKKTIKKYWHFLFVEHLLSSRDSFKCSSHINSFSHQDNWFYRWGNQGTMNLNHLHKVMHLSSGTRI